MRRHSKASAVRSTLDAARSRARFGGAVAMRGVSGSVDGSGAPTSRARVALIALALAAFALLAFASLSQAKVVVNGYGLPSGTHGGEFGVPLAVSGGVGTARGIAVNNSGNGGVAPGTFYAVHVAVGSGRIQRFSPSGAFERAWGQNVSGRDETQLISVSGVSGGSFTLSFGAETTAPITLTTFESGVVASPSGEVIQTALQSLPSIGAGNVAVGGPNTSGGPNTGVWAVRFIGALGGTDVAQLSANGAGLTGASPSISASTNESGTGGNFAGFEICTVAATCQDGSILGTTANGGQLNNPSGVAVNQANGHVIVTEGANRRISEFDADGNFIRAWGFNVDGANPSTGFEICTVAANCKQAAAAGGSAGQFAAQTGQPITDSSGNVWVSELTNRRIQAFDSSGNFLKALGGDVVEDGATGTGTLNGTTSVTAVVTTSKAFRVGQTITSGADIPAGTTITAVGANIITLSKAATGSGTLKPLTVAAGAENVPFNEQQTVTINPGSSGSVTSGTFTLTFSTPNPSNATATATAIPFNATAAELQTKLEGLGTIGAGNVAVTGPTGGPWTVTFQGARFADTDVTQMTASASGLLPSGASVTIDSKNAYELCTIAAECREGAAGSSLGQFGNNGVGNLAFDSAANLYVIDTVNKRVVKFNPALSSATDFGAATFAGLTNAAPENMAALQGGARLLFGINNNVAGERQLVELDPADASVKDTSLAGAGINAAFGGLAENTATGTVYATVNSAVSPRSILALHSIPLPDVGPTMNPITVKTGTTATFSGTIDPQGGLGVANCKFEYSTDQLSWTAVNEPSCSTLDPNGGPQAVSENVTGLSAATHYFVRFKAARVLDPSSAKTSAEQGFDTDAIAPTVTNVGAINPTDTTVRVAATIRPNLAATDYIIEYGTTPALGSSTAPVSIGAGTTPLIVSQLLEGLGPNTTYHFQVTATNSAGSTSSPPDTFTTKLNPPSTGGRSYEMVSPVDKNGGAALSGYNVVAAAPDGEALAFCTTSIFGAEPGMQSLLCADYVSRRGATAWQTKSSSPRFCRIDFGAPGGGTAAFGTQQQVNYSLNLDHAAFLQPENPGCQIDPLDPLAPLPQKNLYRESLTPSPNYQLLAPQYGEARYWASSDDFSHIVYTSRGKQTPDAPAGSAYKVFEWDEGTLRLVSRDPAGNPFTTDSLALDDGVNGVSADGERIFFRNEGSQFELYLREDATTTYDISASECTASCGTDANDVFLFATEDGSRALIRSAAKLTDDDNSTGLVDPTSATFSDLFLYTHSADPDADTNLTLLSRDNEPADGGNADVQDVVGTNEDASVVYFAAQGQIVAGEPTAVGPKIYRWDLNGGSPTVEYLATLNTSDAAENWQGDGVAPENRQVTPDGQYLLVGTKVALDPVADTDVTIDQYRWGQADGWVCVSCQAPGIPSVGDVPLAYRINFPLDLARSQQRRIVMSDDGQRIFFESVDALVPDDVNGEAGCPSLTSNGKTPICKDVYEWHDGALGLVTTGTSNLPAPTMLLGASADGEDVFIYSDQKLVGWDSDVNGDIYDARLGGGLPEPPPSGAPCEGESCRGATPAAPAQSGAGTAAFEGPGNQVSEEKPKARTCPAGKKKVTKNRKTRCVKRNANKKQSAKKRANNDRRTAR